MASALQMCNHRWNNAVYAAYAPIDTAYASITAAAATAEDSAMFLQLMFV